MGKCKIGDIVSRKSYNSDILFKVTAIEECDNEPLCILKALKYRLQADATESDLLPFTQEDEENGKKCCLETMSEKIENKV